MARVAAASGGFLVSLLLAAACSSAPKLVQEGNQCFQATDCADGLVCIPQKNGPSLCSSDLSTVQETEDAQAPKDAAPRDAAGEGGEGGEGGKSDASTDAGGDAPSTVKDSAPSD